DNNGGDSENDNNSDDISDSNETMRNNIKIKKQEEDTLSQLSLALSDERNDRRW
ncbi:9771_t:CDS:1, partial [Ambispora gerdemannii]